VQHLIGNLCTKLRQLRVDNYDENYGDEPGNLKIPQDPIMLQVICELSKKHFHPPAVEQKRLTCFFFFSKKNLSSLPSSNCSSKFTSSK
jgi:hypothetical protein